MRSVSGGLLFQSRDNAVVDDMPLKVVTKRAPTAQELADLKFAFRIAKHVKSNAIVYAKDGATVGIGAGPDEPGRFLAHRRLESRRGGEGGRAVESWAKGSVVASDAFFPFADGLLAAAEAGATAVIQPGGSMRDDEVIKAADEAGLAMVMTGYRHFRHYCAILSANRDLISLRSAAQSRQSAHRFSPGDGMTRIHLSSRSERDRFDSAQIVALIGELREIRPRAARRNAG